MKILIYICFCVQFIIFDSYALAKQKTTIKLVRDSEIECFVQKLINQILIAKKKKINSIVPRLVLNDEINAFITNKQIIFLNTGLLTNIESIDELQGILAHEIGHLLLGHYNARKSNRQKNQRNSQFAFLTMLGLSLAKSNVNFTGLYLASKDISLKNQAKFSRQQEMEADIFSIKTLNEIESNVIGLKNFFERNNERYNALSDARFKNYGSHPNPQNRIELMNNLSKKRLSNLKREISFKNHNIKLDIIKIKTSIIDENADKIYLNENTKNIYFKNYKSLGSSYLENNFKKSLKIIDELIKQDKNNAYLYEISGNINFRLGNYIKSSSSFQKAIYLSENFYNCKNSLLKLSLARTLIMHSDKEKVIRALNLLEQTIPEEYDNPFLWKLIVETSGRLNKTSIAYIAMAEEQLIRNNLSKAKHFAKLGLRDHNLRELYKIRGKDIINIENERIIK